MNFLHLTREMTLPEQKVRKLMQQVFTAIHVLHSSNIIHRDVKMENLLLDNDLNLKITDFGFAQKMDDVDELKLFELCGTVSYMAPEMLRSSIEQDNGQVPCGYRVWHELKSPQFSY